MSLDQENEVYYIGKTTFRNQGKRFGIKRKDRRSHMYILGKTGMGKSTLMKNLILQDLEKGNGLALIDPHGDLVESVIHQIPKDRWKDVFYIDPINIKRPIGINVFEGIQSPIGKYLITSELISVFKKLWDDFWGPRTEYILRNALLALLDYPGTTLLDLPRIFVDANFRKTVLLYVKDEQVKNFWVKEFAKYPTRFKTEAISPIQNKAGAFLGSPLIRNIVGQKKSSFNFREAIDSGKVVLVNLSKGRIGEDTSVLLGSLLITKIELAALSRSDIPEDKRRDFYLYIDEHHIFTTKSFIAMLPESRKHRLCITLANQFLDQLDEKLISAIFGNIGTVVSFRVGAKDAEYLSKEFYSVFKMEDFVNLPTYNIYLKLMIGGVTSKPFSGITLPY